MVASFSLMDNCYLCCSLQMERRPKQLSSCKLRPRADKLQSRSPLIVDVPESSRRHAILCSGASLVSFLTASCVKAEEKSLKETEDEGGNGVLESIKSLFDPNEKTNSGKILPKSYLQAAREVVKTLRDSLGEEADDIAKFRRTADAAKESIRNYLNGWRGQKAVVGEESYAALERAIRSLAGFYSKAGPFAKLPEDVKRSILDDLSTAESSL
ncbi:photosystem II D1 precursor processing protein PSB27-H2, chloroplastic [Iris pallida]|uniref:Photosystem II D1 processing protein PSB27-H2, chloroplastic n=1 Tax=Iris pallida TaxID=29817 RepID=A0AAX6HP48_IRIPA|nr:photosystem II D1 precursor processing protein PSB27-H2, chloroplastic [Iris pallida]